LTPHVRGGQEEPFAVTRKILFHDLGPRSANLPAGEIGERIGIATVIAGMVTVATVIVATAAAAEDVIRHAGAFRLCRKRDERCQVGIFRFGAAHER
jgi:hypothetical protein